MQTAAVLAHKRAKVYLGVRSEAKLHKAVRDIWDLYPDTKEASLEFLKMDLSSCSEAWDAADRFKA